MLESLKGWIIDPNTQAQKTIENYENQRLSIEDAIESGLLNNRADQIFLDYGDIVMGPAVKTPADIIVIRETVKGNSDSKEMQRTATAGFYAGFVGQGIEYTQIISNADYQLSMIITSAKGVNSINNPLSYLLCIKDFLLTQTIDAAKAGLQDAWNGTYDSAIGRKIGAGTFNYLLMTIGGAQLKGKGTACEAVESGTATINPNDIRFSQSSVNGASEIIDSMKAKGWDGDPIDVVRMPDGNLTTIDNTRVLAARYAEIDVQANVHAFDEVLPQDLDLIERLTTPKGVPQTWGDAVLLRIGKQNSGYRNTYPLGSNIIGWSGN